MIIMASSRTEDLEAWMAETMAFETPNVMVSGWHPENYATNCAASSQSAST
jgi:hypothetical protein